MIMSNLFDTLKLQYNQYFHYFIIPLFNQFFIISLTFQLINIKNNIINLFTNDIIYLILSCLYLINIIILLIKYI